MKKKLSTKTMALIGVITAIICVAGPLSVPIGPVPLSLGTLAIYFAVYVLGMEKGTACCLLYLLAGFVGIPVFAGFSSGPAKLLGPTGGYLIGYIFLALISGFVIDRTKKPSVCFLGMAAGTAVLYAFGTAWLAYSANMTFPQAFAAGVLPFIAGDMGKIVAAIIVGKQVKKRLESACAID